MVDDFVAYKSILTQKTKKKTLLGKSFWEMFMLLHNGVIHNGDVNHSCGSLSESFFGDGKTTLLMFV